MLSVSIKLHLTPFAYDSNTQHLRQQQLHLTAHYMEIQAVSAAVQGIQFREATWGKGIIPDDGDFQPAQQNHFNRTPAPWAFSRGVPCGCSNEEIKRRQTWKADQNTKDTMKEKISNLEKN